jgi:hypothetical protein
MKVLLLAIRVALGRPRGLLIGVLLPAAGLWFGVAVLHLIFKIRSTRKMVKKNKRPTSLIQLRQKEHSKEKS